MEDVAPFMNSLKILPMAMISAMDMNSPMMGAEINVLFTVSLSSSSFSSSRIFESLSTVRMFPPSSAMNKS